MGNRIIKFRAWNADDKEMISWSGLKSQGYELLDFDDNGTFAHHFMQFTGLQDKNGVDIYEGDLAKYKDELIEFYWNGLHGGFWCRKIPRESWSYNMIHTTAICEIIGNIHQNPELLKQS